MLRFQDPSLSTAKPHYYPTRAACVMIAAVLLLLAAPGHDLSAAPPRAGTLAAGSASAPAGNSVDVAITLSSGAGNVCTLQFDLAYSSSLNHVSTAAGSAATAASKTVSAGPVSGGVRVLVFNLNRNVIGAGTVAVVTLAIAPGTPAGSIPVSLVNLTASDPDGASLTVSPASGAVTVLPPPDTTPPVISGVASSGITSSGATVSWSTNEASDTQVEYGPTAGYGFFTALNTSLVTSHAQALTGLTSSTVYHYRVRSKDAAGNMASSGDLTFRTSDPPDTTPPVVSGIAVSGLTSTGATITWTTDEASDTQVEFGTSISYGATTTLDANLVTSHSCTLSGLTAATTYHFRVKSKDAAGNLAISSDNTFTTSADTTAPVISGVAVSGITSSGASVSWTTDEFSTSQVEFGPTTDYGNATLVDTNLVRSHTVALTGLQPATLYHARVKSVDLAGNARTSADVTFTTLDPVDVAPPVISGIAVSNITVTGATISWTTNEAANTRVSYGVSASYGSATDLDAALSTSHTRTLSGLSASTTYHFRVESRDAAGNLALSDDRVFATADPLDTTPPVITAVTVTDLTSAGAVVSWTTNEPGDSQVEYGATSAYGSTTTLDPNMVTTRAKSLSGLTASTTYHFRVLSRDAAGNLALSQDFTFRTADPPDGAAPIISTVTATDVTASGATITWVSDEPSDSLVRYGTTEAYGSQTALDSNQVTAHRVTVTGLSANTLYHFQVVSRDAALNEATSTDFTFTTASSTDTVGPDITNVEAAGITHNAARVTWVTNEAASSRVVYGVTPDLGTSTAVDGSLATSHSVALTGLDANTTYYFRVDSADASGNAASSGQFSFTTSQGPDTTPPVIFDVFINSVSSTGASVSWTTNEPADSQLEYGPGTAYGYQSPLIAALTLPHSVGVSGLAPGTTYHFRILSRDADGNLGVSADLTFTTQALPVISGVSVGPITSQRAYVSWGSGLPATAQVAYGKTPDCDQATRVDTALSVNHTVRLNNLEAGATYYFRVKSASATGDVAVSESLTFSTRVQSKVKYSYPNLVTTSGSATYLADGTVVDTRRFTGFTITNTSGEEAVITVTAYDRNGDVIYGPGITNPADRSVAPGAQISALGQELLGNVFADEYTASWVEIESSVREITAGAAVFDSSLALLEFTPITEATTTRFFLSDVEEQSRINLANPNDQPATVTFELRASYGAALASASLSLEPKAALAESVASLFADVPLEAGSYIMAVADVGVVALELDANAARDVAGISALDADAGAATLYAPHYAAGGTSRSTVSIVNLDDVDGKLTLQLVGNDGAQLGPTRVVNITANGKAFIDDQSFFNAEENNPLEGHLIIRSNGIRIAGSITFGDIREGGALTALPLAGRLGGLMRFDQVSLSENVDTSLALANPTAVDAVAEVELYRADGTLEARATLLVPARHRVYETLPVYFPDLEGQTRNGGYIRVIADNEITGFVAISTRDGKRLSALPPLIIEK